MMTDVIALTQEMVRTKSLSGEEGGMAALVETRMRELGFTDVRRDRNGSVLGFVGPVNAELALLFDGHMDVVPVVGDWSVDPFGGEIREGRLYGRGSTDMKGGIAAAMCAVAEAAGTGRLAHRVAVSASVLEEVVEGYALAGVLDTCAPRAVVICEPSKLHIKAGQKGRMEILLTFAGQPAHAASPECGVNPLYAAAQALLALRDIALPSDPVLGDALLVPTDIVSTPYPSISMIPTAATIRFDRRTMPGESEHDVLQAIEACLARAGLRDFTLSITEDAVHTFTGETAQPSRWLPAWQLPDAHRLLDEAKAAVIESGLPVQVGAWRFCTNGSESAGRRGIPTIGLGPGNEEDAHTIDESVALSQLEGARDIYRALTLRLAT